VFSKKRHSTPSKLEVALARKLSDSSKPISLVRAIADGLTGFMTFQSRCGMHQAYSEYFLYTPIVQIVNHRAGWQIESEWPHLRGKQPKTTAGDYKRIDFLFRLGADDSGSHLCKQWVALELKWSRRETPKLDVTKDIQKLREALNFFQDGASMPERNISAYLMIAGQHTIDKKTRETQILKGLKGLDDRCRQVVLTA
jgi:hypothetical protein